MSLWTYPEDRYYYGWYEQVPIGLEPTDGDIKAEIVRRLRANPHTRPFELRVDVKRGVVILRGQVATRLAKRAAGDDCWDNVGVVDVSNQLEVTAGDDADEETIAGVMAGNPVAAASDESLAVAAARMRDADIGSLPVIDPDGRLVGVMTDRDIVVRSVADGMQPTSTPVGDVCSTKVVFAHESDSTERVAAVMRQEAVRRVPVVDDDGRLVGMVSLGDLARTRDPGSVLADISAAEPNNDRL
jgi:CBS domain-containing protein